MSQTETTILFLSLALSSFVMRYIFVFLADKVTLPRWFRDGLEFVPSAVLSALALPLVLLEDGKLALSPYNIRLWVILAVIFLVWKTKNIPLTILFGMLSLWLLQYLFQL